MPSKQSPVKEPCAYQCVESTSPGGGGGKETGPAEKQHRYGILGSITESER